MYYTVYGSVLSLEQKNLEERFKKKGEANDLAILKMSSPI